MRVVPSAAHEALLHGLLRPGRRASDVADDGEHHNLDPHRPQMDTKRSVEGSRKTVDVTRLPQGCYTIYSAS